MLRISVTTTERVQVVDITAQVREAIRAHGVRSGICVVYCPHTTAAITINENYDPDVKRDMVMAFQRIVPADWDYRHGEGNSDSHVQTALVGPSQTMIIDDGELVLGQWQGLFFCEFDGPRKRTFYLKIMSDELVDRKGHV